MEVERGQQTPERSGQLLHPAAKVFQDGLGPLTVIVAVEEEGELQKHLGGDRCAGRRSVIVHVAGTGHQLLVVYGSIVERGARLIPE